MKNHKKHHEKFYKKLKETGKRFRNEEVIRNTRHTFIT